MAFQFAVEVVDLEASVVGDTVWRLSRGNEEVLLMVKLSIYREIQGHLRGGQHTALPYRDDRMS